MFDKTLDIVGRVIVDQRRPYEAVLCACAEGVDAARGVEITRVEADFSGP